ncbi:condensation domain-containing protein [Gordonia sp. CPCC 206044]|uniref:condensation domain-containing protein n=1 Tax=Gordonia sp. CPCC 206044 TaxID=3140793 RepID=UPI003AF3A06E
MKFTELSAYELPAGTVTEWTPATIRPPEEWAVDDRPLSYEHEDHIARTAGRRTSHPEENSWLGAVFEVDRPLDHAAMERTMLSWTRRHEAFRTTVTLHEDARGSQVVRRTLDPGAVQVQRRDLGSFADGEVADHLIATFDRRLSPLTWPHCSVATISDIPSPRSANAFLILFAADHSVMDAYSMFLCINELRTLYDAELDGHEPELPTTGSHVDHSGDNRSVGEELTIDHAAVQRWRRFLDACHGSLPGLEMTVADRDTSTVGARTAAVRQRGWAGQVATAGQMAALNSVCRELGHSTQTAVVTALALAHRELTGLPRMRAVMPMHTRDEPRYVESVGWYVGLGPLDVDLAGARSIEDALGAAAAGTDEAKRLSRLPYPRIAQLLETDAEPEFVISYLDLRFVPAASRWPAWKAQTLRGSTRSDTEVYIWAARTPTGMTVSTRFPGNDTAAANVRLLIDTTAAVIADIAESGPHHTFERSLGPHARPEHDERQPA